MNIEETIKEKRNNLRTDRLDMSFGELMNIFEDGALLITPEYQRTFRWDRYQQSRFVESILLGIPVPPIFVAEDTNGIWELVDGLQRISTVFSFFGMLNTSPEKNNLQLEAGDMIEELKGINIDTLPILLKNTLKRATCRVEIIRWDSDIDMRYELFNRLNTGGTPLSDQEIRNCIFRGYSNEFNALLIEIGANELFRKIVSPTNKQIEEMFCEELVLRYITFKNFELRLKQNLPNHLTEYMRLVSKGHLEINIGGEKSAIISKLGYLNLHFDYRIFRATNGIFTPNYFDAIMLSLNKFYEYYQDKPDEFSRRIIQLKESEEYRDAGLSSYSQSRIENRVMKAFEIFKPYL